jgi:UDP-N-acetylglucosamine 3-dehydrogenase
VRLKRISLGLIGLGGIGRIHLKNCLRLKNAQLTSVADVSKGALKMAEKLGVPNLYANYRDLIEKSDVDAVIIALPTHLHAESAMLAAEYGKHILLEKPLARDSNEGKTILQAKNKYNVKLMIGYPALFVDENKRLKAKIESGELGEIQMIYALNLGSGPFVHREDTGAPVPVSSWWWKKEFTGGGALYDLGSHMISLARWYFGDVTDASSHLGYRFKLEQEDHAVCLLRFKGGQKGVVVVGWFSQQPERRIEVYGTAGFASTEYPESRITKIVQLMLRKPLSFQVPYLNEVQHFVDSIEKNEQPLSSGEDALKDIEVIEAAYANQVRFS